MNLSNVKYPAYPLITCDPFFSVWSPYDELNEGSTRHWTGALHPMTGIIVIDGVTKVFMGSLKHNPNANPINVETIKQNDVKVTPLKTIYTFSDDSVELEVTFMTPLIPDDLKLLSRPVSYISYKIRSIDSKTHNCLVYIDASALLAVDKAYESVTFHKTDISVCCGRGEKDILAKSGDDQRINWGYLHLAAPSGRIGAVNEWSKVQTYCGTESVKCDLIQKTVWADEYPVLYYKNDYEVSNEPVSGFVCIAYDDIHSLEYFGKKIDAYYKKDGDTFSAVLKDAVESFEVISKRVDEFDNKLISRAEKVSEDYAKVVSIAYRQAVAAHKLAWDGNEAIFVSKECFSNGCAATVDVTYPSIPLFLIYNPNLVEYMLNPIFKLIDEGKWSFKYAPHDVGQYPLLNGQVYGLIAGEQQESSQMPVEECGNMLLCVAAACRAKNDTAYAKKHFDVLKQWADYLTEFGYNPENQLCTDDFAGHLAHNCNLSCKAILGIAAWGMILNMMNHNDEAEKYTSKARELASKWKKDAYDNGHYRLAFDKEESWSIKYNLVWDKLFGLDIFDKDVFKTEISYYKTKINKYGLPLDCRSDYTKSDWQMWSTVLDDDKEYTDAIVSAMLNMLANAPERSPFSDWYYTSTAIQRGFQNRTVQGGLFINMLEF